MTAIEAYALSKKIALNAVSGIQNITINGTQLVFQFKNGGSASMNIPLPKDGISITKVEIDKKNHLICTLSDGSTQDAGEIPSGLGGGVIQVAKKANLPTKGESNILYITQNDDSMYYWNNGYKSVSGAGVDGVSIKTAAIEFDGVETTFDLPIDDKDIIVYLNGMYLTEDEDYTLDRATKPNTITFIETWEQEDLCSIVWIKGIINENSEAIIGKVKFENLDTDIVDAMAIDACIWRTDLPTTLTDSMTVSNTTIKYLMTNTSIKQKHAEYVRTAYILDATNKILGLATVDGYNKTTYTIRPILFGQSGNTDISLTLAKEEDINKLFIGTKEPSLAKASDIDSLFNNEKTPSVAKANDIDNLFDDMKNPSVAKTSDIDNLFS